MLTLLQFNIIKMQLPMLRFQLQTLCPNRECHRIGEMKLCRWLHAHEDPLNSSSSSSPGYIYVHCRTPLNYVAIKLYFYYNVPRNLNTTFLECQSNRVSAPDHGERKELGESIGNTNEAEHTVPTSNHHARVRGRF